MASLNRVSEQMKQWNAQQRELAAQFPGDLERNDAFQRQRLGFMERLEVRYRADATTAERLMLVALKEERRKLEKRLYPNRIVRLVRKAVKRVLDMRREVRLRERADESIERVKDLLSRAGFGKAAAKVEHYLKLGQLAIPHSEYLGKGDRVDVSFNLRQDEYGSYHLDGQQATLYPGGKKEGQKAHFFSNEHGEVVRLAEFMYPMLSGRAVYADPDFGMGIQQGKWLQLDFNDKDALGSYRLREFVGFDLDAQINALKVHPTTDPLLMKKDLEQGRDVMTSVKVDGSWKQVVLRVQPQSGTLARMDTEGRPVAAQTDRKAELRIAGQEHRQGAAQSPRQAKPTV